MRRILSGAWSYFRELGRETAAGWNRFFFQPADPTPLGLIRVTVGLLALWSLLVYGLDLQDYFGSQGWADPGVIRGLQRDRQPQAWSFWFHVPDSLLRFVWIDCMVVLGLFTAGLFTRVTGILAWIIIVATVRRVPIALFGFDQILSTLALYLAFTFSSGQAVSLDRFFARWRDPSRARRFQPGREHSEDSGVPAATISANLALRLIQLHLIWIYGMAGLAKVQGPSWWNGMALWGTMTAGEFVTRDFTFLASHPLILNFLTHSSLALELLFPFLVWVRILRPLMIALMVILHLGIAFVAPGLTEFGLAMIAANLAFVSGPWLRSLVIGRDQPALRVLYDGACPRCRASMALLTAADPDHVVEPIDLTAVQVETIHPSLAKAACMESMHVVSRAGKISAGFDAGRILAASIPLYWPLAVVGWLPGVAWAGRRVYNHLAATRPRDQICNDQLCGIHPPAAASPIGGMKRSAGQAVAPKESRTRN